MVAVQNLTVYQGATFQRALILKNESAALINLTGYTFRGQVKSAYSDASPTFSFVFTLRNQATDTGVVDMVLAAASTSAVSIIKKTSYLYDVEMVDAAGTVRRIVEGKLELFPEVTK
jgi:hypothetical protein